MVVAVCVKSPELGRDRRGQPGRRVQAVSSGGRAVAANAAAAAAVFGRLCVEGLEGVCKLPFSSSLLPPRPSSLLSPPLFPGRGAVQVVGAPTCSLEALQDRVADRVQLRRSAGETLAGSRPPPE